MKRTATRIQEIVAEAARAGSRVYVRVGNGTPVAELWLDGQMLVAATAEGGERRVGARLVSTGHLSAAELERARKDSADGTRLTSRLGERVRRDVLTHLARDEARYALAAALAAPPGEVAVEAGDPPEDAFPTTFEAAELLDETRAFLDAVREAQQHAPPDAVCIPADAPAPDQSLGPEDWAILSRADGATTIARLAEECGFPQPEVSLIVTRLVQLGLITIGAPPPDAGGLLAELEAAGDLAALTAAFEHAVEVEAPAAGTLEVDAPDIEALPDEDLEPRAVEQEAPASRASHDPPVMLDGAATVAGVDTLALLRELASLSRDNGVK